ncbi:hypothetical protein F2Q68_00026359 [Brassica cretica]|uniref:Uncharacterized protein n=1 Tax=Brassica cretica TaxID=69181 RepID=A0A8S9I6F2_BRACR|nr:hypothetical protein F2Q68_00026359 [Brassica cretica]
MAIRSLSVAFIDGTARALLVELGNEGKPRPFYRWLFSTLGNGEKRRETVTSLSIGGSLTRFIPDTVAAEPNRKVFCLRHITHGLHTKGRRFIIEINVQSDSLVVINASFFSL